MELLCFINGSRIRILTKNIMRKPLVAPTAEMKHESITAIS